MANEIDKIHDLLEADPTQSRKKFIERIESALIKIDMEAWANFYSLSRRGEGDKHFLFLNWRDASGRFQEINDWREKWELTPSKMGVLSYDGREEKKALFQRNISELIDLCREMEEPSLKKYGRALFSYFNSLMGGGQKKIARFSYLPFVNFKDFKTAEKFQSDLSVEVPIITFKDNGCIEISYPKSHIKSDNGSREGRIILPQESLPVPVKAPLRNRLEHL